jgi:hypothetical protein
MIYRFVQIHSKFGLSASARVVLLLAGLAGMSIFGVLGFASWWPALIAVAGLVLGFLLKRQIVAAFEWTSWAMPTALFISGALLFVGERLGISGEMQLMLITLTTVVVFGIQFWSLSDPSIVKVEDSDQ